MRGSIRILFQDKGVRYALIFSFLVLLVQIILLSFAYFRMPPVIPLFNSLPWGGERLARVQLVVLVPLFLIGITIFNIVLSKRTYRKHALFSRLLAVNTSLAITLSTLALVQIFFLV